jgi:MerR family regulatory protein
MHPVATTGSRALFMRAVTDSRAENAAIGELSRLTGVKIETIRYYERIKMLPAPPRTTSGRRVYSSTDVRILAFIRRRAGLRARRNPRPAPARGTRKGIMSPGPRNCRASSRRHSGETRRPEKTRTLAGKDSSPMLGQDGTGLPRIGYSRCPTPKIEGSRPKIRPLPKSGRHRQRHTPCRGKTRCLLSEHSGASGVR